MNEEKFTFKSEILGNERSIWIQKPEASVSSDSLLIILDGELYREHVGAPEIIEKLVKEKRIKPTIIVYVSYCTKEARWIECPCHPPFANFISDELYPWLVSTLPELVNIKERIIAGLSYTGLAASFVAIESEDLFHKVISQSGSYWSNECQISKKLKDYDRKLNLSFYLDVGNQEIEANVKHKEDVIQKVSQISGVESFRDVLISKGIQTEYKVFNGGHSFEAWAQTLPQALIWALSPTRCCSQSLTAS